MKLSQPNLYLQTHRDSMLTKKASYHAPENLFKNLMPNNYKALNKSYLHNISYKINKIDFSNFHSLFEETENNNNTISLIIKSMVEEIGKKLLFNEQERIFFTENLSKLNLKPEEELILLKFFLEEFNKYPQLVSWHYPSNMPPSVPQNDHLLKLRQILPLRAWKMISDDDSLPEDSLIRKILSCIPVIGCIICKHNEDGLEEKLKSAKTFQRVIRILKVQNHYKIASLVRNILTAAYLGTELLTELLNPIKFWSPNLSPLFGGYATVFDSLQAYQGMKNSIFKTQVYSMLLGSTLTLLAMYVKRQMQIVMIALLSISQLGLAVNNGYIIYKNRHLCQLIS